MRVKMRKNSPYCSLRGKNSSYTLGNNSNSPYCHAKIPHIAGKYKAPHLANTKKWAKWGKIPHIDKKNPILQQK